MWTVVNNHLSSFTNRNKCTKQVFKSNSTKCRLILLSYLRHLSNSTEMM